MNERAAARAEIDFEPERLRAFLAENLPGATGELQIERIGGGQSNPTYFLTFDNCRLVLRKKPNEVLVKSAHDVGREHRIIAALAPTSVPVPKPVLYHEASDVVGTPFYLMERLDGRVFMDQSLAGVAVADRRAYFLELARVLAALHAVDWQSTDLAGLARPGRYLERQVDRWIRAWGPLAETDPAVSRIADWLRANIPATEDVTLVHGDYKFTNVIFDPVTPRMAGVLDWELCAIGDPLTDVAHLCSALWNTRPDEYGGIMGLELETLGLPTAEEFLASYYAFSNSERRVTPFHLVLAHFRNAGIFLGIGERAAAGVANAADASETAKLSRTYVDRALEIVQERGG